MSDQNRRRVVIIGAGTVAQKLARLAAAVDFDVWVIDDRAEFCNEERFAVASRLIVEPIETAIGSLTVDFSTYCVIVTRGHANDEQALYQLANQPAAYIGMIGSRDKVKKVFESLIARGISRESLARVFAPIGFNIGSHAHDEIAISIAAELIAHRNLGTSPAHRDWFDSIGQS
jgi:xanthine dehydrogenase accessory factor